ncbi:MAG: HyaD/HybD family hydrogenase maturation endopeptidase [Saprospiraceae bacterium]
MSKTILILGIGNLLMGDEGFGVHLANELSKKSLPDTVEVLDGGTGGFHLLEFFESHDRVIIVDATLDDKPPGTIRILKPRFAQDFPQSMSTHDIGMRDLVNSLQLLGKMPEIDLIVVSISSIQQQGIYLSNDIAESLPKVINEIQKMLFVNTPV